MEKRYQVFVSSTYKDLIDERIEVIQALLELDCIPVGMEYFPAADESQWDFIKKLIDESDYYIVIIAGKYGSEDESGKSYTQKEYEYALNKGIPIISFVHKDIGTLTSNKVENEKEKLKKLEEFKNIVQKKLCKFWSNPQELGAVVSRSISQAKKNYPRIGWIRADSLGSTSEKEIIQLYKRIELLENEIETYKSVQINEIESLADGDDAIQIQTVISSGYGENYNEQREILTFTWDEISFIIFPKIFDSAKEQGFRLNVINAIKKLYQTKFETTINYNQNFATEGDFYDTYKIQMQLLGYINFYEEKEENSDKKTKLVTLTQKGREKLIKLRAVSK